jgi:hypothetical protein
VAPTAVFLLSRVVSAVFMELAQRDQMEITKAFESTGYLVTHPSPAGPGYVGVLANWDGQWYWRIAEHGYAAPTAVGHSDWAFSPLFPGTARVLMELTGLGFPVTAAALATLCSLGGVLLAHRLVAERAGDGAALTACLLLCVSMASPALQIAYTEGPALLLITAAIWSLRRRRYLPAGGLVWALALTRPVVLPLVAVVAVHFLGRVRAGERGHALVPPGVLLVSAVAAAGAWPAVVGLAHGRPTAYAEVQNAWRLDGIGPLGIFSVALEVGGRGWLAACLVATAGLLTTVARLGRNRWTPEVRVWALSYPLYLLCVVPVVTSMFRFLLLAFPLFCISPRSVAPRIRLGIAVVLALTGLLLQWYWVANFLTIGPGGTQTP